MPNAVTARFYVSEMTRNAYNPEHASITLKPAYRGQENKAWATATPSGEIKLQVNNVPAVEQFDRWFREGTDVHLTFEPAEAAPPTT
jgi:hypothetical protein